MPYAYYYDVPSTPEMYRAVTAEIGDQRPTGLISHLVVHEREGLRHYGVWERRTDWEQYRDDVIRPAVARVLQRTGIPEPAPPDEHPLAVIDVQTGRTAMSSNHLDPSQIMQLGEGFMASKTLLSAIELELFTHLASTALTASQIRDRLGLHPRAVPDFPDALLALGMLTRDGDGPDARYANTPETAAFLDKASPTYIGGVLEMCNARLYRFWGDLTEALKTGQPQNEVKHTGRPMFDQLYSEPARLQQFMNAMTGASMSGFYALAEAFDFSQHQTLCDVGGATGQLAVILARRHSHLRCTTFDLPVVEPLAKDTIEAAALTDRVTTASGNFFTDPLPPADVITMGMILHDWNLEQKLHLIQAPYDALPPGGVFICIEPLIDDARRADAFAFSMSLNVLIEFGDAFGFTAADFTDWCIKIGFERVDILPLAGPMTAGIAHKASAA